MEPERKAKLTEEERQAVMLAIAELALARPGWDEMLRAIAEKFHGVEMFDGFKRTSADRVRAERAQPGLSFTYPD